MLCPNINVALDYHYHIGFDNIPWIEIQIIIMKLRHTKAIFHLLGIMADKQSERKV